MLEYYAQGLVRRMVMREETLELISAELRRVGVDDEALAAFRAAFLENLRKLQADDSR